MSPLKRLIAPFAALFRSAPAPDTTPELEAVEQEIELDEVPESVIRGRYGLAWQAATRKAGVKVEYGLGFGGKDPNALHPYQYDAATKTWRCDCSGWLCWLHRRRRQDPTSKRWLNTDEMERLAKLHPVAWRDARVGDSVVYGAGRKIGHCGEVEEVGPDGPTKVMHCRGGKAVVRTGPDVFLSHGAVILRWEFVEGF